MTSSKVAAVVLGVVLPSVGCSTQARIPAECHLFREAPGSGVVTTCAALLRDQERYNGQLVTLTGRLSGVEDLVLQLDDLDGGGVCRGNVVAPDVLLILARSDGRKCIQPLNGKRATVTGVYRESLDVLSIGVLTDIRRLDVR